jgi:hypothetical protein
MYVCMLVCVAVQGLECQLCFEDLDTSNYVEYKVHAEQNWLPWYVKHTHTHLQNGICT